MGFLSHLPILNAPKAGAPDAQPPSVVGGRAGHRPASVGGRQGPGHVDRAADRPNCKRPGCEAPSTGTHRQLCAGHEDELLDLFRDIDEDER